MTAEQPPKQQGQWVNAEGAEGLAQVFRPDKLQVPIQTEELNFDRFANIPEYRQVNYNLLRELFVRLPNDFVMVDVASGTGLVAQIMIDLCEQHQKKGRIIGVEPVLLAIKKARQKTRNSKYCEIEFVQGFGQHLKDVLTGKIPSEGVDAVTIHDAIHEIDAEGKIATLRNMHDIARPGAWLTMNSTFTTEGQGKSGRKYGLLVLGAHKELDIPLEKPAIETLKPEEYDQMLEACGFTIITHWSESINMTDEALQAIFEYPPFLGGSLPAASRLKIPLLDQSNALKKVRQERDIKDLDRVWYQILAQKTPTQAA